MHNSLSIWPTSQTSPTLKYVVKKLPMSNFIVFVDTVAKNYAVSYLSAALKIGTNFQYCVCKYELVGCYRVIESVVYSDIILKPHQSNRVHVCKWITLA